MHVEVWSRWCCVLWCNQLANAVIGPVHIISHRAINGSGKWLAAFWEQVVVKSVCMFSKTLQFSFPPHVKGACCALGLPASRSMSQNKSLSFLNYSKTLFQQQKMDSGRLSPHPPEQDLHSLQTLKRATYQVLFSFLSGQRSTVPVLAFPPKGISGHTSDYWRSEAIFNFTVPLSVVFTSCLLAHTHMLYLTLSNLPGPKSIASAI